jgi:predicted amino acid racemase
VFLDALQRRNPGLLDAAVALHRSGQIPPGSFVVDVEQVEANARSISEAADRAGLELYFMTKQVGRNPVVAQSVARWIPAAVAVDLDDAAALAAAGVRVGHIGHLVQPPTRDIGAVLELEPEVITVFSIEKARQISDVAHALGREQQLLLRVRADRDEFFPGQGGGIDLGEVERVRDLIEELPAVRVAGVTTYPVFRFEESGRFEPTRNMATLLQAAARLGSVLQLNAPGHSSVELFAELAAVGATHAEPGHALTGTTPAAAVRDIAEVPSVCYVTEVSHRDGALLAVFGGGFYERGHARAGLVYNRGKVRKFDLAPLPRGSIDYYRFLEGDHLGVDVGDAVVFAFRFQIFTSRAKVATVAGVSAGAPELIGLHDAYGRPVGRVALPERAS